MQYVSSYTEISIDSPFTKTTGDLRLKTKCFIKSFKVKKHKMGLLPRTTVDIAGLQDGKKKCTGVPQHVICGMLRVC
jgi:hypothetical protein